MRLLLDSHVLVWWLSSPEKLSSEAINAIESVDNEVYLSSASLWELQLKASKGKLSFPTKITKILAEQEINELPIRWKHTERIRQLPAIHLDPFDRILIAQSIEESLTFVTRDGLIQQYPIHILKA